MDFDYSPQEEAFRQELRSWLEANPGGPLQIRTPFEIIDQEDRFQIKYDWQKKLHKAGWVGIHWPKEYGGRGATIMEQTILPARDGSGARTWIGQSAWHFAGRSNPDALGNRRAERTLCSQYSER